MRMTRAARRTAFAWVLLGLLYWPAPRLQFRPLPPRAEATAVSFSAARVKAAIGQRPIHFEANQGQADPEVKFRARGPGYTLSLTATEVVWQLRNAERGMRNAG
jgi:hypothetical protein